MVIDYSKGTSMHRLYGHFIFLIEADKQNKSEAFTKKICKDLKCPADIEPVPVYRVRSGVRKWF